MRNGTWTSAETAALEMWYPEYGTRCQRWEVNGGDLLKGRSKGAIAVKAQRMGLRCRYQGPRIWPKAHDRMALAMLARVCRETGKTPYEVLGHLKSLVRNNAKKYHKAESVG